jgi:Domain of unknown function (DUF1771)
MGNFASAPSNNHDHGSPEWHRTQADELFQQRDACFKQSQAAFRRGDQHQAKQLSQKGKALGEQAKAMHAKAAELIYANKNKGRGLGEVDLHGLRVGLFGVRFGIASFNCLHYSLLGTRWRYCRTLNS